MAKQQHDCGVKKAKNRGGKTRHRKPHGGGKAYLARRLVREGIIDPWRIFGGAKDWTDG